MFLLDPGFNQGLLTIFGCQVSLVSFNLEQAHYLLYLFCPGHSLHRHFKKSWGQISCTIFHNLICLIVTSRLDLIYTLESIESCFFSFDNVSQKSLHSSLRTFYLFSVCYVHSILLCKSHPNILLWMDIQIVSSLSLQQIMVE